MDISTDLPIMYSIACLLLGLGYAFFLYRKERLLASNKLKVFLFSIRTLFIGFLAVLLLNPIVKSTHKITEKPIVILAQDISESIIDSSFLTEISKQLSDFEVHQFSFADKVYEGFKTENTGLLTNYSNLFEDFKSRFENQHIAAMVLASDGMYNTGANPLYSNLSNYPIYTIAQGDTNVKKDVSIAKVLQNEIAFLGNTFPLEIAIAAEKCSGENIQVNIWNNGKKIHSEKIAITSDNAFEKVKVKLLADAIGLQHYTINVTQFPDEKNIKNNSYTAYVEVIDSRYKILVLTEGSHPDIAAYASAVEKNKNYALEQIDVNDFKGNIEAYQLLVLFGVKQNTSIVNTIKKSKIPLLVFNMQEDIFKQFTSVFSFTSRGEQEEEVQAIRNESFTNFTFSPDLLNLLDQAPPLYTPFGKYTLQMGAVTVLFQQIGGQTTSNPVIILDEQKDRKMAFVTAEGFWKWKLYDYAIAKNNDTFNELFSKLTQYLVLLEDKSKFRVNYKNQITENENIFFEASLYNESYELVNNKEVELIISNEKGENFNYEFSKAKPKYSLNAGVLDVGKYTFLAKVKGSEMLKKGSFDVKAIQLEQLHTVANHKLLYQLSDMSSGALFYPNQTDKIVAAIKQSKKNHNRISSEEKLKGIVNIPWILLSLLSLISLEWFLRKYNGLI